VRENTCLALVTHAADIDKHILDQRLGEGSAKRILLSFENSSSESVEYSTKFLAERAKDRESNGYGSGTAGVDDRKILNILRDDVSCKDVVGKNV
jgi:hypothetical protein